MKHSHPITSVRLVLALGALATMHLAGCAQDLDSPLANTPAASDLPALMAPPARLQSAPGDPQWCVWLKYGEDINQVANDYGLQVLKTFPDMEVGLLSGPVDPVAMGADPRVRMMQANEPTVLSQPVDLTMGFNQGGLDEGATAKQPALVSLQLEAVHRHVTGRGVRVAVLDTGVDPTHPHLASRVELPPPTSALPGIETANGVDDDGDGRVDDAFGHGTHVAGIIATVAPNATIIPLKVLSDDGVGDCYDLAVGLFTAYERGAHIVNLSLVLTGETRVIDEAIHWLGYRGVVVVGAAGNVPGPAQYPASDAQVLSIAATTSCDILASFSASGDVRLAAPGVEVESSYPGNRTALGTGTSMACAVASGCLALLSEHVKVFGEPRPMKAALLLGEFTVPVSPQGAVGSGRVAPFQALGLTAPALPALNVFDSSGDSRDAP